MSADGNPIPVVTPIRNAANPGASASNAGPSRPSSRAVSGSDIVFVNGLAYNGRGYRVCGVSNQRGTLCGRIGQCPFHAGKQPGHHPDSGPVPKRRRVNPAQPAVATTIAMGANSQQIPAVTQASSGEAGAIPDCVRRMDAPPTKSRFKRSWTPAEHKQFLISMKKYGKGKWKEISREVKTRTANQCQSHAQKYFLRQAKSSSERKKKSIHDLTEVDLNPPTVTITPVPEPPNPELVLPKIDPLPATIPTVSALPSPPPPVQSPSVYLSNHPPAFTLQQDNHPGASNVDALASVALATATTSDSVHENTDRSKVINAVVNAALKNASPAPLSNATVSEGASHVSSAGDEKTSNIQIDTQTGELANISDEIVAGEQEDEASENEAVSNSALLAKTDASLAATTLQIQALAQAAQQAAQRLTGNTANSDANGISTTKPNGVPDISSLQGSFSQLLSNPQALLMLNPLIANMTGLAAGAATVGTTVAPVQRMRVTVHENGKKGGGMALLLPESNLMEDFFAMAKEILNAAGDFQRVFTRSGGEITSLDQMCQDDALWLSNGEEFSTPM